MDKKDESGIVKETDEFCVKWGVRYRIGTMLLLLFADLQLMFFGSKHEVLAGLMVDLDSDLVYRIVFYLQFLQTTTITVTYISSRWTYCSIMLLLEAHCESVGRKLEDIKKPDNVEEADLNVEKLNDAIEHHQEILE
jgi:hypothetical protein